MVGDSGAWRKLEGSRSKIDSRLPAIKDVVGAGEGPRGYLTLGTGTVRHVPSGVI